MAEVIINDEYLRKTAEALRRVSGKADGLKPSEFEGEILRLGRAAFGELSYSGMGSVDIDGLSFSPGYVLIVSQETAAGSGKITYADSEGKRGGAGAISSGPMSGSFTMSGAGASFQPGYQSFPAGELWYIATA